MKTVALSLSLVFLAYLTGSIPFGLLIARARGVDIRKVGSGNIGATNVFRSVGKIWGIVTFVLDALKGFIPAYVFPHLHRTTTGNDPFASLAIFCAVAAILGHNFPVYLRFKGGKGVATSAGALIGIAPVAVGVGLACWLILFTLTRYVSVASIGAALVIAIGGWMIYMPGNDVLPAALSALGLLVIWRHKSNIRRLLNGTEPRIAARGQKSEVSDQGSEIKGQKDAN